MTERGSRGGAPGRRAAGKRAGRTRTPVPGNDDDPEPTGFDRPWLELTLIGLILGGGCIAGGLALVELLAR